MMKNIKEILIGSLDVFSFIFGIIHGIISHFLGLFLKESASNILDDEIVNDLKSKQKSEIGGIKPNTSKPSNENRFEI